MQSRLANATQLIEETGLEVKSRVLMGDPTQTIVDEAKRLGIDTIFLGTRDVGLIGSLFGRSVSASVAARAACSVEIAKSLRAPEPRVHAKRLAA
jgi:nucleotide-binding universal stress UspA family protein